MSLVLKDILKQSIINRCTADTQKKFCGKSVCTGISTTSPLYQNVTKQVTNNVYHCRYCSFPSTDKASIEIHEQIHLANRPFQCLECGKGFTQKVSLQRHMRIHTGELPYLCDVCKKRFRQKSNLIQHIRKHHNAA